MAAARYDYSEKGVQRSLPPEAGHHSTSFPGNSCRIGDECSYRTFGVSNFKADGDKPALRDGVDPGGLLYHGEQ